MYYSVTLNSLGYNDLPENPLGEAEYRAIDPHLGHTECNVWLR